MSACFNESVYNDHILSLHQIFLTIVLPSERTESFGEKREEAERRAIDKQHLIMEGKLEAQERYWKSQLKQYQEKVDKEKEEARMDLGVFQFLTIIAIIIGLLRSLFVQYYFRKIDIMTETFHQ